MPAEQREWYDHNAATSHLHCLRCNFTSLIDASLAFPLYCPECGPNADGSSSASILRFTASRKIIKRTQFYRWVQWVDKSWLVSPEFDLDKKQIQVLWLRCGECDRATLVRQGEGEQEVELYCTKCGNTMYEYWAGERVTVRGVVCVVFEGTVG
jgi:Zn finger protein HypA/HybF involved in hydrogenase expression